MLQYHALNNTHLFHVLTTLTSKVIEQNSSGGISVSVISDSTAKIATAFGITA